MPCVDGIENAQRQPSCRPVRVADEEDWLYFPATLRWRRDAAGAASPGDERVSQGALQSVARAAWQKEEQGLL